MAINKRYMINTQDGKWFEVQDWRTPESDDSDDPSRIEIVAKVDGPPAVGEEEIRLWLTTTEAQELAEVLDIVLDRAGMVIADPQL